MSTYQKQCILAYFGLYSGALDGIWGPLSRSATKILQQQLALEPDGIFGPVTEAAARNAIAQGKSFAEPGWEHIRHFRREDFRCKCGGRYCCGFPAEPDLKLAQLADRAIDHFGKPFAPAADLVSGLRCPTHNQNEGGVAASRHIRGKAMDLRIPGISAAALLSYLQTLPIRYAYAINSTNVHFDVE